MIFYKTYFNAVYVHIFHQIQNQFILFIKFQRIKNFHKIQTLVILFNFKNKYLNPILMKNILM